MLSGYRCDLYDQAAVKHGWTRHERVIDNKASKKRYRADVLIEDHAEKYRTKIKKDVAKGIKRFGDDFE